MSMQFTVLASGSSGNASLLQVNGFGVLIDVGLGPRLLNSRLAAVGARWDDVHAAFLTHVHADHWRDSTFAHLVRRKIPLYCHAEHADSPMAQSEAFGDLRDAELVRFYEADRDLVCGSHLRCRPFALSHDCRATCGFRFEGPADFLGQRHALAYATDLGAWQADLVRFFRDVDVLALEFNHDVEMERTSGRSPLLIARVLGDEGHLSNAQATALVREVIESSQPGRLRHLVQLHLSRECNRPNLAHGAVRDLAADHAFQVHTAHQFRPGPKLKLDAGRQRSTHGSPRRAPLVAGALAVRQLCLPGWEG